MMITLAAVAGLQASVAAGQISPQPSAKKDADRRIGDRPNPVTRYRRPNGPGWSQAQVKRMARKRRAVQRHRAHCKRARA